MSRPNIYDFLDVVHYLETHLEWKKSQDSNYSITKWAEEMGLPSKVILRFVLKKQRRISSRMIPVFKSNLKLSPNEAEYFDNLVAYSQAKTTAERQGLGTNIIKLQRAQFQQKVLPPTSAARHVFSPVILTLLTFQDIYKDKSTIAKLLMITENEAEQVLSDLEKDGLISKNTDGTYQFSAPTFRIPADTNLKKFYEYWIDRSKQALQLPVEVRKYRALKFALSQEEYVELTEKLNEHAMLLLSKYQSSNLKGRCLYMFESSVFPISLMPEAVVEGYAGAFK